MHIVLENKGNPRFVCDSCSHCHSLMGVSLCKIANRGCCYYWPKFSLYDIQKMTRSPQGCSTLRRIVETKDTKVYNYYIQTSGYFDKEGYKRYMFSDKKKPDSIKDKSVFFKACPFVKVGMGCTIPVEFRSYVCNFFICNEVRLLASDNLEFQKYLKERDCYIKWLDWENQGLKSILMEKDITLERNYDECLQVLMKEPMENYEFPELKSITIDEGFRRGA